MRRRLGVLGGSFDPVHLGHIAIARAARDRHRLERIVFAPNRAPPHKEAVAPAEDRYRMVCLAVKDEAGLEATDRETRREGVSYTVDTLREIRDEEGSLAEVFFIVGSDSLPEMPSWRDCAEILRLARVVVVSRSEVMPGVEAALGKLAPAAAIRQIEADLVVMRPVEISSTEIRARVRQGLDLRGYVPAEVEAYIRMRGLYRA